MDLETVRKRLSLSTNLCGNPGRFGEPISSNPPTKGLLKVAIRGYTFFLFCGAGFLAVNEGIVSFVYSVGICINFARGGLKVFNLMSYDFKNSLRSNLSLFLSDIICGVTANLGLLKFKEPAVRLKSNLIGASSVNADFVEGLKISICFAARVMDRSGRMLN